MASYQCEQCGASFPKLSQLLQHRRTENHWKKFSCPSCKKVFNRKQNLDRHMKKHAEANNQHCPECLKVFSREDALDNHLHVEHDWPKVKRTIENQRGGGPVKRQKLSEDPSRFYDIEKVGEKKIEKFRSTATYYKVNIKDIEVDGLQNILKTLKQIFQSILYDITHTIHATDLVRISIDNPELDFPITLEFMQRQDLTVDKILSEIERVLQSYQQFIVDETFRIDIVHVQTPYGKGYQKKAFVDLSKLLHTKGSVIQIKNKDDLCCARAIITAIARLENHPQWNSIRKGTGLQKILAEQLHQRAGVPLKKCGIEEVKKFQAVLPDYQIHVLSKDHFNGIIYDGKEGGVPIYLYYHDAHFDVITKMTGFLNRSYFCKQCKKGYNTKESHSCNNPCVYCHNLHEDREESWQFCEKCNRHFLNETCYQIHLTRRSEGGKNTCEIHFKCKTCDQAVNMNRHKKEHVCHEHYCKTCKDFVSEDHLCYMQPVEMNQKTKISNKKEHLQYIFFDLECTQDEPLQCAQGYIAGKNGKCDNCGKSWCGTFRHSPNLCVAHKVCSFCLDTPVSPESSCQSCGKNERLFQGTNTTETFCKWLFSEENKGATVICHNFKGYDSYPILQYLHDNAILPKVITTGSKYMSITVPGCKIRMIDSLNFIPMPLAEMPCAFDEAELTKGYFPHLFNRKENQHIQLQHLPDIQYYTPDNMKPKARQKFLQWYEKNKNKHFDFQTELLRYCQSDVDILRKCCLKFRALFMTLTKTENNNGIDPFEKCITIASACNLVYRTNFLKHESIAIIPPHGYRPEAKQSAMAYQWMSYLAHDKKFKIQHGRNSGEKEIGPYKIDGYYKTSEGQDFALEFHGCFWHGCPRCFSKTTINPVIDMSMGDLYARTMDKRQYIESKGYKYVSIWECDFKKEIENNINMKQYIQSLEIVSPLEPRDAFFGGRTEAFKLIEEASATNEIKYYDVTSLYPFINKTGKIPIGHPEIITENFKDISLYEGLIKCKILPPRSLYIPVLPMKCNGKLMFSLCRTCTENNQQDQCTHNITERAFIGTWVTDEVKEALSQGYTIQRIYEVWHFEEVSQYDLTTKTGGIFTEYVNTFLKIKQEASGWPDWCVDEDSKKQYIHDYFEKEGVSLDYNTIEKNPGLRALAKLMLNSFWGKFGQRTNLTQTSFVSDPVEFFDTLTSDKQRVKNIRFINDESVQLDWIYNDDFIEPSARTNVVIAAYTTAQARLKLYSYLKQLGKRVLYCDTDSIVFNTSPGEWEPPLGDYLGDLTNEVPDNAITAFTTGGPKNYAYTLQKQNKAGQLSICKVRGITLNFKNSLDINFQTVKDMVTRQSGIDCVAVIDENKIVRNPSTGHVITKREVKDYKIVFDKRVITDGYKTQPYGY